jgi:predicted  nucleic acid-binding Zn-ribbon protein
LKIAV